MPSRLDPREVSRARIGPRQAKDPRSKEYAIQTLYSLKRYLESLRCDQNLVRQELEKIEKNEHWRVLGYSSREEMFEAELAELGEVGKRNFEEVTKSTAIRKLRDEHPQWTQQQIAEEVGCDKSYVSRVLTKTVELPKAVNNDPTLGQASNTRRRRLAREHRELFARVEAGELSVHRACVEAGIVRPPTPLDALRRAWRKASEGERRAFAREALHGIGGAS